MGKRKKKAKTTTERDKFRALCLAHGFPYEDAKIVERRRSLSLWGGCGSIHFYHITISPEKDMWVVHKRVVPRGDRDERFERRVASYITEASFYQHPKKDMVCVVAMPLLVQVHSPQSGEILLDLVLSDVSPSFPRSPSILQGKDTLAALQWLASFHAYWWEGPIPQGAAPRGSYWYLSCRQTEWKQIPRKWKVLQDAAAAIDRKLAGCKAKNKGRWGEPKMRQWESGTLCRGATLLHGDSKVENMMFNEKEAAFVDFQYFGGGMGEVDVVQVLVSSVEYMDRGKEGELLRYYHEKLNIRLKALGKREMPWEACCQRYELALMDFLRFLLGWGEWGAVEYAKSRVEGILARLVQWMEKTEDTLEAAFDALY